MKVRAHKRKFDLVLAFAAFSLSSLVTPLFGGM